MLPLMGAGPSAGGESYSEKVLSYSPIAYWKMNESSGAAICSVDANQNGTYTNCTLGQTGIGDGETSALFDNDDCYVDVYSTTLRDAFNYTQFTLSIWCKVFNAGVWTDADNRKVFAFANGLDVNHIYMAILGAAGGILESYYKAGGTADGWQETPYTPTAFFHYALECDKTGDALKLFYNGSQIGSTLSTLGTWSGVLTDGLAVIGAWNTSANTPFHGYLAHAAVFDSAIGGTAIADLATV